MTQQIPMEKWGKAHWSVFAYIETRCVDFEGMPNLDHMRTDPEVHPGLVGPRVGMALNNMPAEQRKYPTRLRDGTEVYQHDDWSCLEDAEAAGLLKNKGTGVNPRYELTKLGRSVADELREHKRQGGRFSDFEPSILSSVS